MAASPPRGTSRCEPSSLDGGSSISARATASAPIASSRWAPPRCWRWTKKPGAARRAAQARDDVREGCDVARNNLVILARLPRLLDAPEAARRAIVNEVAVGIDDPPHPTGSVDAVSAHAWLVAQGTLGFVDADSGDDAPVS